MGFSVPARRVILAPALALALAVAVASCSSSSSSSSSSSAPASSAPPATSAAASTPAATGTSGAVAQITANWEKFFDKSTSVPDRLALLQNGPALQQALEQRAQDPLQKQATASVKSVQFTSPTEATVTYDVALNGQVALPGAMGQAVLDQGVWKVSSASFCSLISLGATAPIPGCS